MPTVIISPCGTSLLTNETETNLRSLLNKVSNCQESELEIEPKKQIANHVAERGKRVRSADINEMRKLSAELNGIITFYGDEFNTAAKNEHILLATDTYLGRSAANLVAEWLKGQGVNAFPKVITDLSTKNLESFRSSMSEIIRWCAEELEQQYPRRHWKVVFNLTGGFKSVNGFLQAIAMFYADESIYIFESGGQLLTIPRLPVQLDPEGVIGKHLSVFRRLAILKQELKISECKSIPETLLIQIDDRCSLSEWGELVWKECRKNYYSQDLLPPLSSKLSYSDRFRKDFDKLPIDRRLIINERLDQVSCYLDSNRTKNPRSLDFKPIQGRPFKGKLSPEPTHECDAWSDQDAKRLYGYFNEEKYIVHQLGSHL